MNTPLSDKRVAILAEDGFEESELMAPMKAMQAAGIFVEIISPEKDTVQAWDHDHWSFELPVDVNIKDAISDYYDALVIPGGVMSPDKMRTNYDCIQFARDFLMSGKPIGAICHGPQLLIETGLLEGRIMTSYCSVKTDLINAGVKWVDREVVDDNGLITSRSPEDLPAFNKMLLKEIEIGVHDHATF
jgi:protease I